ncbi:hypothetical protein [Pseudarthrobacter sp. WHRI 8279]|uniref:hypothetical protein n=1 Tax=Pseudarthrobacter sp. WHRI 8279 TaxID=3162566 RepID=UPI0032ECC1EC
MQAGSAGRHRAGLWTAAAAFLALPLWLGGCVAAAPPESTPAPAAPLALSKSTPAVPRPLTPGPQPQGPARTEAAAPPARSLNQASAGLSAAAGGPGAPLAGTSAPSTPDPGSEDPGSDDPGSEEPGTSAPRDTGDAAALRPSARPLPAGSPAAAPVVTAYYVLLDDGGRNGVRFGCNDSLVGISHASPTGGEVLPAAVGALLDTPGSAAVGTHEPEFYNALAGSRLKFLSGSFDGTTVTVYLAGTMRPGGACDLPRMEAQLTQTAVAAVGAIRAEIYVNGLTLNEVLSLD